MAFGIKNLQDSQRRVLEVLELVGLAGMQNRYPHQLSGGQQQRVALARTLAPHPSVILMDEPFNALDATLRPQVREQVEEILRRSGTTAILVTHDAEEAMIMADRVAVVCNGSLEQVGSPGGGLLSSQDPVCCQDRWHRPTLCLVSHPTEIYTPKLETSLARPIYPQETYPLLSTTTR